MEEIFQDQNHDARKLYRTCHRESLTRAGGTVGEHTSIVTLDDRWNQLGAGALVDVLSWNMLIENAIEEVPLLATAMQYVRLFVLLHALHVNFVKN